MFFKKLLLRSHLLSVDSFMVKTATALLKMTSRIVFKVAYTLVCSMWKFFLCIASNTLVVMLPTLAIVSEEIKNAVCTYWLGLLIPLRLVYIVFFYCIYFLLCIYFILYYIILNISSICKYGAEALLPS